MSSPNRELPISLQGIEKILICLNDNYKVPISIREISKKSNLSMRVVKNILLQLEKFNQVERVVEGNNIIPKWSITKFGKRVLKEANGLGKGINFVSREEELLSTIIIQGDLKDIKDDIRKSHEAVINELNNIQVDLSKILGSILNINHPVFEDLISFVIKRVKFLKQKFRSIIIDPTTTLPLKKVGEKPKKITKEVEHLVSVEIFFLNSVIINEIKRIFDITVKVSKCIDNLVVANGFSIAADLREEIRILSTLIYQREEISVDSHILSNDKLKILSKNKIELDILDNLIEFPVNEVILSKEIEDLVLKLLDKLTKGETELNDHNYKITDFIPIFNLYQLILDEKPNLNFTIEKLEESINNLTDNGYIPGIKSIQDTEGNFLKVVQFKAHDVSEDETKLVLIALKLQKFTLADIVDKTGWAPDKSLDLLYKMTNLGILNYSKSFLHGEQWYVRTEQKN
ncbi:MAG: hypothetical protein KGD73_11680 [Candidatus Lokiarchaeota archaeon]|nr:hypothetical protein [Candidatus Lokiarchaeota archaeon]